MCLLWLEANAYIYTVYQVVYQGKLIHTLWLCHKYGYNPSKTVFFIVINVLLSIYMYVCVVDLNVNRLSAIPKQTKY